MGRKVWNVLLLLSEHLKRFCCIQTLMLSFRPHSLCETIPGCCTTTWQWSEASIHTQLVRTEKQWQTSAMKLWLPYSNICVLTNNTTSNLLILIIYSHFSLGLLKKKITKSDKIECKMYLSHEKIYFHMVALNSHISQTSVPTVTATENWWIKKKPEVVITKRFWNFHQSNLMADSGRADCSLADFPCLLLSLSAQVTH